MQYFALIIATPLLLLMTLRKIDLLINLAKYGIFAHFLYMSFLIYWLVDNIQNGNISNHIGIMPLFTTNIAGIAGNFTTAFALHN